LEELLLKFDIHRSRVIIHEPFKDREELLTSLAECDIYLDSFPYSGMTSILDPMKVNLPIISLEGKFQRERMSSSSLKSLGLSDWITENTSEYLSKAVYLYHSRVARQNMRTQLAKSLSNNPPFIDSVGFSKEVEKIFEELTFTK
jgi:predicted O-linked N-acetylglucosamine transferase (SPINDLY family)